MNYSWWGRLEHSSSRMGWNLFMWWMMCGLVHQCALDKYFMQRSDSTSPRALWLPINPLPCKSALAPVNHQSNRNCNEEISWYFSSTAEKEISCSVFVTWSQFTSRYGDIRQAILVRGTSWNHLWKASLTWEEGPDFVLKPPSHLSFSNSLLQKF